MSSPRWPLPDWEDHGPIYLGPLDDGGCRVDLFYMGTLGSVRAVTEGDYANYSWAWEGTREIRHFSLRPPHSALPHLERCVAVASKRARARGLPASE